MEIKTDIQIAQENEMAHISQIAEKAGLAEEYVELYGNYKAEDRLPPVTGQKRQEGRQGDPGDGDFTDAGRRRQDDHYRWSGGRHEADR